MFDPTTAGLYIAAGSSDVARAQAVSDSLGSGTLTLAIYDTGSAVYSGTFAGPLTVGASGEVSGSYRPTGTASGSGTPDAATWKARISNASGRWLEGTLGPTGRFQLSDALSVGRSVTLNFSIAPQPGAYIDPGNPYNLAPLGSYRLLLDSAKLAELQAKVALPSAGWLAYKTWVINNVIPDGVTSDNRNAIHVALVGVMLGNDTYRQQAVDMCDTYVAFEEARIAAIQAYGTKNTALNPEPKVTFDSYLYVGGYLGALGVVYDWCRDLVTDAQRVRWYTFGNQVLYNLWDRRFAEWGGVYHGILSAAPTTYAWGYYTGVESMGWAVNDPYNNYHYSFLEANLRFALATFGDNPEAGAWLSYFRETKMAQVLATLANLPEGGSLEENGYGIAMSRLFSVYDWWQHATGENLGGLIPNTEASISWEAHSITPPTTYVLPNGDHSRDATARMYSSDRSYLIGLITQYPASVAARAAATLLDNSMYPTIAGINSWGADNTQYINDFVNSIDDITRGPITDLGNTYWAPSTGQLMMRSSWNSDGTYANLICGPFTQNHAHQDQGAFLLFKNAWLAQDANQQNSGGTKGTFQDPLGVSAHNTVRVAQNGTDILQSLGSTSVMDAISDSSLYLYANANLTQAYSTRSQVTQVVREFVFVKPDVFVILDRVTTSGTGIERIFTINTSRLPVAVDSDHFYVTSTPPAFLTSVDSRMDVYRLAPAGLTLVSDYWPSLPSTKYTGGYRNSAADSTGDTSTFLHVIDVNQVVASAVRSDATGLIGTLITLSDGSTATVRFNTASTGGSIELVDSGATTLVSEAFTTTVNL